MTRQILGSQHRPMRSLKRKMILDFRNLQSQSQKSSRRAGREVLYQVRPVNCNIGSGSSKRTNVESVNGTERITKSTSKSFVNSNVEESFLHLQLRERGERNDPPQQQLLLLQQERGDDEDLPWLNVFVQVKPQDQENRDLLLRIRLRLTTYCENRIKGIERSETCC